MSTEEDSSVTIFFVDDSLTDRVRGAGLIRKARPDWTVVELESGSAALQQLRTVQPDLIVTDLVMPEMDGRALLKVVSEEFPLIPVVLITAQGDDRIAAECVGLGAVNYVPKRALADDLVNVLTEVIQAEEEARLTRRVLQFVKHNRCEFEIDSELDQIRSLVNFVHERLQALQLFSPQRIRDITGAVRESLLNAHFHGNLQVNSRPLELTRDEYFERAATLRSKPDQPRGRIRLIMSLQPEFIRFQIEDDGPGFDQSCVGELDGPPQEQFQNGNGIRRMQTWMGEVLWNQAGNAVTLTAPLQSH